MNTCSFDCFYNTVYRVDSSRVQKASIAFKYLSEPYVVLKMINTIELGIPPLNAICSQLEKLVDCSDIVLRQIIGKEIRFILNHYGYVIDKTCERQRLRSFSKSKYFKVSSMYIKDPNYVNKYKFNVTIINMK